MAFFGKGEYSRAAYDAAAAKFEASGKIKDKKKEEELYKQGAEEANDLNAEFDTVSKELSAATEKLRLFQYEHILTKLAATSPGSSEVSGGGAYRGEGKEALATVPEELTNDQYKEYWQLRQKVVEIKNRLQEFRIKKLGASETNPKVPWVEKDNPGKPWSEKRCDQIQKGIIRVAETIPGMDNCQGVGTEQGQNYTVKCRYANATGPGAKFDSYSIEFIPTKNTLKITAEASLPNNAIKDYLKVIFPQATYHDILGKSSKASQHHEWRNIIEEELPT